MHRKDPSVPVLLTRLREGDDDALDELLQAVYDELRYIARNRLKAEQDAITLRTTELVHEAYLKLVRSDSVDWQDRQHFFAVAARAMRQVLVDHARQRTTKQRRNRADVPLDRVIVPGTENVEDLIALDDALTELATQDERAVRVVECRFFGGYTIDETADILDISTSTVERDWRAARAWLSRELLPSNEDAPDTA